MALWTPGPHSTPELVANPSKNPEMDTVVPKPDVAAMRLSYRRGALDEKSVPRSPFALFETWFNEAKVVETGGAEVNAMCLSTVGVERDENGQEYLRPSARMVLMKGWDESGFTFYTNYRSRKAQDLTTHPFAALTFYWPVSERSVRVEGQVEKLPAEVSDAYFKSRPHASRVGAWASAYQSSPVEGGRATLEKMITDAEELTRSSDASERPSFWGGYRVVPKRVEFWQGREGRMHDRVLFQKNVGSSEGQEWSTSRLSP
ncbi:pyridoxamine 5'-phosphate oxidase [Zopfochytrium polystomum]|nr:pyridoxamine 5'-phosphate oxidase [Zopfochytrium polystomum]